MRRDSHNLLNSIDALIRQGKGQEASLELKKIQGKSLAVEDRVQYASLARRLSLPHLSLRLLNPIVRPTGRKRSEATPDEWLEYAGALVYIGAMKESLDILNSIPATRPNHLLFRAFSHIGQWDYAAAIPLLNDYIQSPGLSHYQQLVGEANLCEALTYLHDERAGKTIEHALEQAKSNSYTIVHGHLLMTKTTLLLDDHRIDEARRSLAEAESAFEGSDTVEAFFVRKWRAIIDLHEKGHTSEKLVSLHAIRKEARERWGEWETLRHCDFYEALYTKNEAMALYLYRGTPFESFRNKLLRYFPEISKIAGDSYSHTLPRGAKAAKTLELFSGDSDLRRRLMESGKLNGRLIAILLEDFYRPQRVPQLSALLYPGEFYNPDSSARRVRETIRRLRQWFRAEKLPLTVEELSGDYSLGSKSPVELLLPKLEPVVTEAPELVLLKEKLQGTFTVRDVCTILDCSLRTANRILQQGEELGMLVRSGKGRATHYGWTDSKSDLQNHSKAA